MNTEQIAEVSSGIRHDDIALLHSIQLVADALDVERDISDIDVQSEAVKFAHTSLGFEPKPPNARYKTRRMR